MRNIKRLWRFILIVMMVTVWTLCPRESFASYNRPAFHAGALSSASKVAEKPVEVKPQEDSEDEEKKEAEEPDAGDEQEETQDPPEGTKASEDQTAKSES